MTEKITAIIGGTGLGDALASKLSGFEAIDIDTPFGKPSDSISIGTIGPNRIAFLNRHGSGHKLSPSEIPYTANIFALKKLGATSLICTGAVGSLRQEFKPGDLVIADQFIDKTFRRQSSFFRNYAAVHCEFAHPTCERLASLLKNKAEKNLLTIHPKGTYVCMEGPQFSTRAESMMHRSWGADLIGMTALPEAKLAREAQMCYALVALVSDYDCWQKHKKGQDKQSLLQEIISNLNKATDNCLKLIMAAIENEQKLVEANCPCRQSLALAVWTKSDHIDDNRKKELEILFQ